MISPSSIFRGRHLCIENYEFTVTVDGETIGETMEKTITMPGEKDMGTPLIITENGRRTILGIMLYRMQGNGKTGKKDINIYLLEF